MSCFLPQVDSTNGGTSHDGQDEDDRSPVSDDRSPVAAQIDSSRDVHVYLVEEVPTGTDVGSNITAGEADNSLTDAQLHLEEIVKSTQAMLEEERETHELRIS